MTIELMRALAVGVASVGLVLAGCNGGSEETPADGDGASQTETNGGGESGGSEAAGGSEASGGSTASDGVASGDANVDPSTPDGSARVLLQALAEKKFDLAAAAVMPDSPGKAVLDQWVDVQAQLEAVTEPNMQQAAAQMIMRDLLNNVASMFAGSTVELVTVEGDTGRPLSSTTKQRSASPSNARPRSAPVSRT